MYRSLKKLAIWRKRYGTKLAVTRKIRCPDRISETITKGGGPMSNVVILKSSAGKTLFSLEQTSLKQVFAH